MDLDLKKYIETYPMLTYRWGWNLRDRLILSHYFPPNKGCFKRSGCVACKYIETGPTFHSNVTKEVFYIRHFISCRSLKVIYKARCVCSLEYVGKITRELRRRIGEHFGEIRHQHNTSLARHIWMQAAARGVWRKEPYAPTLAHSTDCIWI